MNETSLDWDDLRLFLAVARAEGLSAAARKTGKSAATLGRRMQALERASGLELFHRRSHAYELTERGADLLEKVAALEARIRTFERLGGDKGILVKVSAGTWTTLALCRAAPELVRGNPEARLRFISAEEVLSISHREAVIGIRNRRPEQPELVCRRLGRVEFAGYAISGTVDGWIQVAGNTPSARWLAAKTGVKIALEVAAPRNALDLATRGMGRVILPTFVGEAESGLERVTAAVPELAHDQWLVTHSEERFRPEVRKTIDRIYEEMRKVHRR